jgi:hypothetical protein
MYRDVGFSKACGRFGAAVCGKHRFEVLEDENRKLKKLLAESVLDNAALKELLSNVWSAPALQGFSFCCRKQLA